jgi:hypothetical protein
MYAFREINDNVVDVYPDNQPNKRIGQLVRDVDGYFYFWDDGNYNNGGCQSWSWFIIMADKLKELNGPTNEHFVTLFTELDK